MKQFAVSLCWAWVDSMAFRHRHLALVVGAGSEDEAVGIGVRFGTEHENGRFATPTVSVCEISDPPDKADSDT